MAEWCGMGKDRLMAETAERLEAIAAVDPQNYVAYVCRGVISGLHGNLQEGLIEIEKAIPLEPEEWDAYFWKGMICVYLGRYSTAKQAIEKALEEGLPPILLTPLYWLEKDRPDFFRKYAEPLLKKYNV
jgi:tetratricopeptide (TPR) repeat protein